MLSQYGTNGLSTLKAWAGVHAMILKPSIQTVHQGDPFDLLDRRPPIELPALVMTNEVFVFSYNANDVASQLEKLAAACRSIPGCVVKWNRPATQEEVDAAWKP